MRVVIAGGHGQIALLAEQQLSRQGHTAVGIIRSPEQAGDLAAVGAEALVLDLEHTTVDVLADALTGADAVVFAAGAGPASGAPRKLSLDRDGALLLAAAAVRAGVRRYVMVSAMGADAFDAGSSDVFQIYLRAKSEADAGVRSSDLDWTILRPGGLTDDLPTGLVEVAASTGPGTIPRADVATAVVLAVVDGLAVGAQVELVSGAVDIRRALASH